jgi:hypothetical protein
MDTRITGVMEKIMNTNTVNGLLIKMVIS